VNDPVALMLQFGFLAVLYLFLLWVARSALRDLSRHDPGEAVAAPGGLPEDRERGHTAPDLRAGVQPRLEVVAALGRDPGTELPINGSATLGRSQSASVRIDDPFASSAHARIFPRDQFMYVEDMGSTNGTYLNGRRLRKAERLKMADVIRIGDTEYRYKE
jgi:hypothetical protein